MNWHTVSGIDVSDLLNWRTSIGSGIHPCSLRHGGMSAMASCTCAGIRARLGAVAVSSLSYLGRLMEPVKPEWTKLSAV